jgi:hypothetical protein
MLDTGEPGEGPRPRGAGNCSNGELSYLARGGPLKGSPSKDAEPNVCGPVYVSELDTIEYRLLPSSGLQNCQ